MQRISDHVLFYTSRAFSTELDACVGHVVRAFDDDTVDVFVMRPDGSTAVYQSVPQCDPATPTAGHWSIVPA